MDLNRKLTYGAIFFVLMLLLGGLAAMLTTRRTAKTAAAVRRTDVVLDTLDTSLRLLIDVESGARGYELTGRDEFLEPYRSARAQLPAAFTRLRALTADDPREHARLDRL